MARIDDLAVMALPHLMKAVVVVAIGCLGFTAAAAFTGGFGVVEERRAWCADHGAVLETDGRHLLPHLCLDAERRLVRPPM